MHFPSTQAATHPLLGRPNHLEESLLNYHGALRPEKVYSGEEEQMDSEGEGKSLAVESGQWAMGNAAMERYRVGE